VNIASSVNIASNIAFQTLLIFLFVLPGIASRYTYTRGLIHRWSNIVQIRPWTEEILPSLALALSLQIVWYWAFGPDNIKALTTPETTLADPIRPALYFLDLTIAGTALGFFVRWIVITFALDLQFEFLRFSNMWHYLLTGEVFLFNKNNLHTVRENRGWLGWFRLSRPTPSLAGVFLSAVVEQGGEAFVYRGIVKDFWFNPTNGDLDGIQLMLADRRDLSAKEKPSVEKKAEEIYYEIRGDFFVLRYSVTRNVNLRYFSFVNHQVGGK
jgi:hypothetical protein